MYPIFTSFPKQASTIVLLEDNSSGFQRSMKRKEKILLGLKLETMFCKVLTAWINSQLGILYCIMRAQPYRAND